MSAEFYVHIVESPSPEELHNGLTEGKALYSFLDIAGIPYSYSLAVDLDEFHIAMTEAVDEAIDEFRKPPILHLSAHGSELGIQLTSREELFWPDLADYIRPINEVLNGGLGVCMSCCGGGHGTQMAEIIRKEKLPYKWITGSSADVMLPDVALAYSVFYRRFHCGDYEVVGDLVTTVRAASAIDDFDIWDGNLIQEEYLQDQYEQLVRIIREKRMERIREKRMERIRERIRGRIREEYIQKITERKRKAPIQETPDRGFARRREESRRKAQAVRQARSQRRARADKEQIPPTLYTDRIVCNPQILAGKPTVKGTRISVELITDLLESGSTVEDIMHDYPHINEEDIEACRQYKATGAKLSNVTWEDIDAIMDGERA